MSLRIWLPMTKDLRNQGLDEVEIINYGATFNSEGKLGGCYYFDGTDDRIAINGLSLPNVWSYSCWIYSATSSRGWESIIMLNSTGGDSDLQLGFYTYPGGNRIQNTANGQYNSGISWTYGVWHHFCGTFDGNSLKTYIDGILVDTKNITASLLSRSHLTIGARCNNSTNTSASTFFQGKLNDVRIYDHCLSPMEVKQISQGLVLHYPLDRNGWGQENLLKNSGDLTLWSKESGINCEYDSTVNMYKIYSTTRESSRWGIYQDYAVTVNTDTNYTFSLTGKTDGYSAYLSFGAGTGWPANYTAFTSNKQRLSKTLTIPAGTTNIRVYLSMYPQTGGGHVYFEKPKLEEGSIATPWCPNSSDALATTMGMNDGIEYDCSGFGNNGTRTGIFTWTSNTLKYTVSQVFNGVDNAIQTPNLTTMVTDKNYTITCWTYKTVIGTKNYQTIYGGPSGFELEARSSSSTSPLYRIHNWGGGTTAYNFGEWTHFCFVHTDSDSKLYVNGELKITGTSVNIPSGNYFVGAWNTATQQNFEGLMSDFRIYATALSAEDVLSLYQNSAYIDSSGNVYGAVHEEV